MFQECVELFTYCCLCCRKYVFVTACRYAVLFVTVFSGAGRFFRHCLKNCVEKMIFRHCFEKKHFSLSRKTFFQRKVVFSTQLLVLSASLCQKIIFLTRGKASLVFSTRLRRSAPASRYEKLVLRHL